MSLFAMSFGLLVVCSLVSSRQVDTHLTFAPTPSPNFSLPVLACVTLGYAKESKCVRGLYKPSGGVCASMIAAMNQGSVFLCYQNLMDYCRFPAPADRPNANYASLLITGSSDELNLVLDTNCQFPLNTLTVGTYPCFKQLGGRSVNITSSIFGQVHQAATTNTFGLLSGLLPGLCSNLIKIP